MLNIRLIGIDPSPMACTRALHRQAVEETWTKAATEFRQANFPVSMLRCAAELLQASNTGITQVSDDQGVLKGDMFKVLAVNMSFMGPENVRLRTDVKNYLSAMMSNDDIKTCALVIAPTVGEYGGTYDEATIEKVGRDLCDELRDESGMVVKPIAILFDAETMWSDSRGLSHTVYMCISKKVDPKGKSMCAFARSNLWIRGALADFVKVVGRSEQAIPSSRLSTGDRGHLSEAQSRKQWMTGQSFYNALANGLWNGMGLNSKHTAAWIDITPYDGHLPMGCISRSGGLVCQAPSERCISLLWTQTLAESKLIESFIEKRVLAFLRAQSMTNSITISGAPDLAAATSGVINKGKTSPTYSEDDFKLCKPMADQSLPFRKTFVDKWHAPGISSALKDDFRAVMQKHGTEFNKSGIHWTGDTLKRKADEPAEGAAASTLAPQADCPKSQEEIKKTKAGELRVKEMKGFNLLVTEDGTVFVECLDGDLVVLASEQLCICNGEWLVGLESTKAKTHGAPEDFSHLCGVPVVPQ